jgi:tRNA(fMet)-specific endonuclease VapC
LIILLDTNTCIAIMTGRKPMVRFRLRRAIAEHHAVVVPSITAFELWFGAANSGRVAANTEALKDFLEDFEVLPFDGEDARLAGSIRSDLRSKGTPIGTYDVLIAAQTLRHDALLVTANVSEFSRVAHLRWENWEA